MPSPKLFSSLPKASNWRTGATVLPAHVFMPHRSATQILPPRSISTALVEPQVRGSGSLAQFSMVRYGLGWELGGAPGCAHARTPDMAAARATGIARPALTRRAVIITEAPEE